MADLLGHPFIEALAWSLVHFLWQGVAIALVAAVAMRAARTADGRYFIGVGALAAMLAAPILTTALLLAPPAPLAPPLVMVGAPAAPGETPTARVVASPAASTMSAGGLPIGALALMWAVGVLGFTVRLGGGWIVARRLARRAVRPAEARLQALAADLAIRLQVRRAVAVLESSTAAVPMLVGWLKPAIVLPAAALAGLSPAQIEALLAHELAHVRRHDFLVNVLQSLVEAALFYHPAVWWLSRRVRQEREHCCDDLAVGLCDRLVYATALTDLAVMTTPRVALAATDGHLISRVRRVLAGAGGNDMGAVRWVPAAILAVGLGIGMPGALLLARTAPAEEAQEMRLHAEQIHAEDAQAAQTEAQREAEIVRLMRELELRLAELRQRDRTTVDRARPDSDVARREMDQVAREMRDMVARTAREAARQSTEVQSHRRDLEAARALASKGLVTQSHVREIEEALARAQRHNVDDRARAELDQALRETDRARQLVEKGLLAPRALEDMQLRAKVAEQVRRSVDEARIASEALSQRLLEQHRTREITPERRDTVMQFEDQTRVITSGDVLRITISGEPDLPSTYQVRTDGTVRIPLLGAFKVVGQTSQQVKAAIGRKLSDLRLGSASSVTIQLPRVSRIR